MHWQDSELGYGLRRPSGYPIHDRRTSAPFRTEGRPSGATHWQWHYGGPDVLSPEEEAELEALRLQAAHLRQEALREETSKDGLERQVELLRREYRFALDEQHRLEGDLRAATAAKSRSPQSGAESAEGAAQEEQAMDSARRLLAKLLTSDLKAKQVSRSTGGLKLTRLSTSR